MAGAGVPSVATCTTVQTPTETGATTATFPNNGVTQQYHASKFVAEATNTICAVDIYISKVGTPSDTMVIVAKIYADDGGDPGLPTGAAICSSTNTVLAKDLGDEAAINFTGMSCSLTNTTKYWISAWSNEYHASNSFAVAGESGGTTEVVAKWNTDAWALSSTARTFKYVLYRE